MIRFISQVRFEPLRVRSSFRYPRLPLPRRLSGFFGLGHRVPRGSAFFLDPALQVRDLPVLFRFLWVPCLIVPILVGFIRPGLFVQLSVHGRHPPVLLSDQPFLIFKPPLLLTI
ncbi:MAG: hypothetical protein BZY88_16465 [SAR202 cluster bacterium Io17-Chloro-G9]|nr:MAG: hypothetical protein BZY88_16465 [SAR202 cluster bacterium Io17-Chloro-G9]